MKARVYSSWLNFCSFVYWVFGSFITKLKFISTRCLFLRSAAYETDCKLVNKQQNKEELIKLYKTRGLKIYKRFYEPRLEWFHQQREYCGYLRQDEFYYKHLIENFMGKASEKEKSSSPPDKIFVTDSFGTSEDSEAFFENLMLRPCPFQSSPLAGSESLWHSKLAAKRVRSGFYGIFVREVKFMTAQRQFSLENYLRCLWVESKSRTCLKIL